LLSRFEALGSIYTRAVDALNARVVTSSARECQNLRTAAEKARSEFDSARAEFQNHQRDHVLSIRAQAETADAGSL
jgi:uncharacterized membrane-anchored protein YhcB (DUF1043 family)